MMSPGAEHHLRKTSFGSSPTWCAYEGSNAQPARAKRILQFKGFGGGVPSNTETTAVKPRAGIELIARRCLFFVEMAKGRGSNDSPGPLNFRGCGLTAECLLAREMVRVRFPAAAPISFRLRVSTRPSPQNSGSLRAARRQPAHFHGVVADK